MRRGGAPHDVLVERKATWTQAPVFTGDRVYLTLPGLADTVPTGCNVTAPNGDQVELEVRRRDAGLTRDFCAVLEGIDQDGRHRYFWTLADGRLAKGSFRVGAVARPAKVSRRGRR